MRSFVCALALVLAAPAAAPSFARLPPGAAPGPGQPAPPAPSAAAADNRGVVELETSSLADGSVAVAQDLARIIDDGTTRRVLPVLGKSALQGLSDLISLRGIDMAIVQTDVLDYAAQRGIAGDLQHGLTYVSKLPDQQYFLLARSGVRAVADLANRPVGVGPRGDGPAITSERLFAALKVPVSFNNDRFPQALEKLQKGDLAAVAFIASAPLPELASAKSSDGLHFVPIPFDPSANPYAPSPITNAHYPNLVPPNAPVDSVAVGTALVVANLVPLSDRYKNVANFVDAFFTQFQSLQDSARAADWADVNLAAELPGWRRFPPAENWLRRNAAAARVNPQELRSAFAAFIDKRQQSLGGSRMSEQQKDELFQNFLRWSAGQKQ